jgi:hypothetical protein
MAHDELNPESPEPPATERRRGPGIMVFSSEEQGGVTDGALPVALTHLIEKMREVLERRPLDRNSTRLNTTRVVVGQDKRVLLQAFGSSDRFGPHRSRIVVTMEEMTPSVAAKSGEPVRPSA